MQFKLLVDSKEFWEALSQDIRSAQQSVFIITFSFEGDKTGKMLAEALISSTAVDKRIIVDDFTKWMVSDKFLYSPRNLFNTQLRQEVHETYRMIDELEGEDVKIQFTKPVGLFEKFAVHNHKKVVIIDGRIAYIGGVNFSEHNFAWHDAMLRIDNVEIAQALYVDFLATWRGEKPEATHTSCEIELYCISGTSNHKVFRKLMDLIEGAQDHIYVESPYITFPFLESLQKAASRGCVVTIITPGPSNHPILREYILWEASRLNFDVRLFTRMAHLKAMLIDQRYLIFGSSNFDYFSYQFHQEIVTILTHSELISDFMERVFLEDIKNSKPGYRVGKIKGGLIEMGMRASSKLISLMVGANNHQKMDT